MPAWTAFGWKSSAIVPRSREPPESPPPQPATHVTSAITERNRRTAAKSRRSMNTTEVTEVQDRGPAAYLAEFVGTLLLVFFITAVVSLYVTTPSQQNPNPFVDFSVIGLVHVLVLFTLVQTLAVISGAHFNPAIT